jgi:predicted AAA+ superfamily ATPase
MYNRIQNLSLSSQETCFLWGPRQTGKSTLLKTLFPNSIRFDLLLSTEYQRLLRRPSLIREQCLAVGLGAGSPKFPIIIDEIQKIPALLDEIHWLIENMGLRFILCGSSARKLNRRHWPTIPT